MSQAAEELNQPEIERQSMEVDIACAGFGPATAGFLTTLTRAISENPMDPAFESKTMPGMPLQVMCYERADDLAAGVSGVVTQGRAIRASFPEFDPAEVPMAAVVKAEKVFYLLDPIGASRRSGLLRFADSLLKTAGGLLGVKDHAFELPWTPPFLNKHNGLILSMGQFMQWNGNNLMGSGLVQIWPGTPVAKPLVEGRAVKGVRLADQGVDKHGVPSDGFMAGMDVLAQLTVVGDGPVGAVGQALDRQLGMPAGHGHREWALGMKFVIELPEETKLETGTVWHSFGFPEPEIFGFLYVHPDRLASVGVFVPSWMGDPARTAYRYLQHYIQHPALWPYLKDGTLRSWGAKSLEESGRHGEPFLSGDGFARIGEGSGSTNMLTGSGVDEAWATGTQLAEAVIELLKAGKPFTGENLAATYEKRRRSSWVETGSLAAEYARAGFHGSFVKGMIGMGLAGLTGGALALKGRIPQAHQQIKKTAAGPQLDGVVKLSLKQNRPLHDAMLSARGWPEIELDGRLLISHQDALLMGGKVQANPGFADHVAFRDAALCKQCGAQTCVAMCSGQAITTGEAGCPPDFEREKCVHCGACLWNCSQSPDGVLSNLEFSAGAGGLHSAEN